jgi:hypothetical protein
MWWVGGGDAAWVKNDVLYVKSYVAEKAAVGGRGGVE